MGHTVKELVEQRQSEGAAPEAGRDVVPRRLRKLLTPGDVAVMLYGERKSKHTVGNLLRRAKKGLLPAAINAGLSRSQAYRRWCPESFRLWLCATMGRPYLLKVSDLAARVGRKRGTVAADSIMWRIPRPLRLGPFRGERGGKYVALRWPIVEVDSWTRADRHGECWGPLRYDSRKAVAVLGRERLPKGDRVSPPGGWAWVLERAGVIGQRVASDGSQGTGRMTGKKYSLRADLEARFRRSIRRGRRLPSEWAEPLLVDRHDLAALFSVSVDQIRLLRVAGRIPEDKALMPSDAAREDLARRTATVWHRDDIESWVAQAERAAAEAQAHKATGGFVSPEQLARAFQVSGKELEALGIPHAPEGYRVDIVVNWLAEQREAQTQRDEVLARVACLSQKEAARVLGVSAGQLLYLAGKPERPVVGFQIPSADMQDGLGQKRRRKHYRLQSLRAFAAMPKATEQVGGRVREGELAKALGVEGDLLRRMHDFSRERGAKLREEFFARADGASRDPFKATPDDAVFQIYVLTAEEFMKPGGQPVPEPGGSTLTAARRHRETRLQEEWDKVKAREEGFPNAIAQGGVRWYGVGDVGAWLDALEQGERERLTRAVIPSAVGEGQEAKEDQDDTVTAKASRKQADAVPAKYREEGKTKGIILTRAYIDKSKKYPIQATHLSRLAKAGALPACMFHVPAGQFGKAGIRKQLVFEWKPLAEWRRNRPEGPTL